VLGSGEHPLIHEIFPVMSPSSESKSSRSVKALEFASWLGAPQGNRTPNQQIMRRFGGHQQGQTKRDNPVFTESAAVKVC
jgi:hypothetical protein